LRNRFCQIPENPSQAWDLGGFWCYVPAQVRRSESAMRDAITGLIGRYDQLGRYLDRDAIDRISSYFSEAQVRLAAVELINREATELVREAAQRLWLEDPELILPGGNAYTTRRLSACLRDMDYFLRYASYALIADDATILNERVLNGLDDTYKSLGVPTGPTVRSIALLADVICEQLSAAGIDASAVVRVPFDHLCRGLAATNVRAR
jgi:phycobilisome core component